MEDAENGKNTPCGLVAESVRTFHCRPSASVGTEELESLAPLIGTEERYWLEPEKFLADESVRLPSESVRCSDEERSSVPGAKAPKVLLFLR